MTLIPRLRERRRRPAPAESKLAHGLRRGECVHPQEAFIAALRMGEEQAPACPDPRTPLPALTNPGARAGPMKDKDTPYGRF